MGLSVLRHVQSWFVCCCLLSFLALSSGLCDKGVEGRGLEYPCENIIYVTEEGACVFRFVLIASFFLV